MTNVSKLGYSHKKAFYEKSQVQRALKDKLGTSKLSVRVIADALNTSPSQVMRLLQENKGSKQFIHLIQLAGLAGYQIEFSLKKKKAA